MGDDALSDALDGDLEVDAQDAEQVKGGTMSTCPACGHSHRQSDPKCVPTCPHGSLFGTTTY